MSPVIILGLVLMWAVVLVPMWLRRHDEVEESRSVDKFSTAMSTLSSREGRPTQRNVQPSPSYRGTQSQHREAYAMKREAAPEVHVHVSGASAPEALAARRKRSVARRRRQLLLALAVSVLATLIAAVVLGGILLWSIQIVLDLGTITYFTHLRRMALHAAASRKRAAARRRDSVELAELERETSWDRPAPAWEEGITVHRGPVPATTASFASTGSAAAPVAEAIFDQTEPWDEVGSAAPVVAPAVAHTATGDGFFDQEDDYAPVASRFEAEPEPEVDLEYETEHEYSSERAARAAAHAAAEVLARGGKPWEPVPVPKPTYATKPVAPSRPVYEAPRERLLPPVESTIEMQADDDLEAILDRRWAVND